MELSCGAGAAGGVAAPAAALAGDDAWLAASACGLSVTVALGAAGALGIGVDADAPVAGADGSGGVAALAPDDEVAVAVVDGRVTLRLGEIMRTVLPREAIRARRV